jgi:hypothetical protein
MIELFYGNRQRFRYRHRDVNLLGRTHLGTRVVRSHYALNGGPPTPFYVEPEPPGGGSSRPLGTRSPSIIRLSDRPGHFNIEIPTDAAQLIVGQNDIEIAIQHEGEETEALRAVFDWDERPLPADLTVDLSGDAAIQDVAQVVDGRFELGADGVIRSVEPIGADVLLLIGSPHGSQEATYDVRFGANEGMFIGLSDFFVAHLELDPELGIKPGYSSAGLATIRPSRWAEAWLLHGALLEGKDWRWPWALSRIRPLLQRIRPGIVYRVRHQVLFAEGVNLVRFRIWRKGAPEPRSWTCEEHDADLADTFTRHSEGSFGLCQYGGRPTEWSNIRLRPLDVDEETRRRLAAARSPLRRRARSVRRHARFDYRAFEASRRLRRAL